MTIDEQHRQARLRAASVPEGADDMVVTMDDCLRAGHCARGVRKWFNLHGLDFRDFMAHGIEARAFIALGDGMSLRVVEHALARGQRTEDRDQGSDD